MPESTYAVVQLYPQHSNFPVLTEMALNYRHPHHLSVMYRCLTLRWCLDARGSWTGVRALGHSRLSVHLLFNQIIKYFSISYSRTYKSTSLFYQKWKYRSKHISSAFQNDIHNSNTPSEKEENAMAEGRIWIMEKSFPASSWFPQSTFPPITWQIQILDKYNWDWKREFWIEANISQWNEQPLNLPYI